MIQRMYIYSEQKL